MTFHQSTVPASPAELAEREAACARREALVMLAQGRYSTRLGSKTAQENYRRIAKNILHRSVAVQARYLGIETYGWLTSPECPEREAVS